MDQTDPTLQSMDQVPVPSRQVVAAVVVSYFTGPVLFNSLQSLLQQPELGELILVNNGNPPETLAALQKLAESESRLKLINGQGNVGFAAGCNLGAKKAKMPYLLFLNPDCELPPDGLHLLLAAGEELPRPWLLSGRLTNPDGSEQRGSRRAALTPKSLVVEGLRLDRILPRRFSRDRLNLHETDDPGDVSAVPVVSGACMFLSQEDLWSIGGWDEGYFLHVEDIDFCHRFNLTGGRIYHLPQLIVRHQKGTSHAPSATVEWHKTKGFLRYFETHFRQDLSLVAMWLLKALIFLRFLSRAFAGFLPSKEKTGKA